MTTTNNTFNNNYFYLYVDLTIAWHTHSNHNTLKPIRYKYIRISNTRPNDDKFHYLIFFLITYTTLPYHDKITKTRSHAEMYITVASPEQTTNNSHFINAFIATKYIKCTRQKLYRQNFAKQHRWVLCSRILFLGRARHSSSDQSGNSRGAI